MLYSSVITDSSGTMTRAKEVFPRPTDLLSSPKSSNFVTCLQTLHSAIVRLNSSLSLVQGEITIPKPLLVTLCKMQEARVVSLQPLHHHCKEIKLTLLHPCSCLAAKNSRFCQTEVSFCLLVLNEKSLQVFLGGWRRLKKKLDKIGQLQYTPKVNR